MPNRTSYSEALSQDLFKTISSTPENSSFQYIDLPNSSTIVFKWLLPGEELKMEEQEVGYLSFYGKTHGRVFVTNYRLRFEEYEDSNSSAQGCSFDLTLGSISKVDKIGFSNVSRGEDSYGIEITCKDMRNVKFLHRPETHSRRALYDCLRKYAFPNSNKLPFFATLYKQQFNRDGWNLFNTEREFKRQKMPKDAWSISRINANYEFAPTYPSVLAIPTRVLNDSNADEILRTVGEFRSKQRIPVLSWIDHKTYAALVRSSQPLVGVTSRKSAKDEEYLESIINANPNADHLIILDARPSVNAKVNRAKGGGYEEYPRCELEFLDIQNIHVVRDSLKRLKEACFPKIDHKNFYKVLDETKWLNHIQTILDGSTRLVEETARNKNSVLIHCSDGWDRTAQITSLAMLQLDPYYRTIEGFAVLIEKEWCSFGHKFAHRIGHGEDKHGDGERSPIFVQFIDCVWQLFNQFTSSFEFNVKFLKTILDELYACRFGSFLYNSEKERRDLEVKKNTVSLWSYVLDNLEQFHNPTYDRNTSVEDFLNSPKQSGCIKLWTEYYCRYNPEVCLPESDLQEFTRSVTIERDNHSGNDIKETIRIRRNTFLNSMPHSSTINNNNATPKLDNMYVIGGSEQITRV
ncbi:myotubularin-like phosphatase domain-containing protein [Ditylenchus destructor]|uniref:phosphatidylinositol-3,5-bisphosphate 3-phosphatase n=1 Tax=Ditylenchus destructor TaxID=166010 RepID=A0AAD4MYN7_9BILA|nr:myotubularin-like phosphatase domain-containing protein [Ditylenchus destructor]